MEANLSEYITEYYSTDYEEDNNYDEEWAEKEDVEYQDRVFEELNGED